MSRRPDRQAEFIVENLNTIEQLLIGAAYWPDGNSPTRAANLRAGLVL
ncbi:MULTISPECIES: hypothetical protein [unclassified Bradyrhizobium]|nr:MULTISPECIES: hypothetical protein [unclassified Bradyrhizobium]MCA1385659.1 hypothetical protein [Bradyrhizobium sp. BRP05]MCA1394398.1 hypothetical protein [Bradyrhizobium sp. IC3123]MCA1423930.1 hypothetical protein [Bradyrhizobium sp. BRP23]MCA1430948.1 hypothetical protein [Bradyrhizobium sp. NBAIM16]MCA1438254.1 hypothetical protein [Bradyrhizobium sp. BRP20]